MTKNRLVRWLSSSTWSDRFLAVIALSPVLVLTVRQFMELGNEFVPCCDFAALELGTRAFLRGEQLVGLYSREGWRHPGPAPFLWSSIFRFLPGNSFAEHQVAAAVASLSALVSAIVAPWRKVTPIGRTVIIVLVSVFIIRFGTDAMRVPWNPYLASMWLLAGVIWTATFTRTRSAISAGLAVFAVSMAAQSHVGAAPAAFICLAVIGAHIIRNRHQASPRSAWTAGVIIAVMWFLPLADLAFGNRNLLRIVTTSSATSEAMNASGVLTGVLWLVGNSPGEIGETFGPASPFVDVRGTILLDVVAFVLVTVLTVITLARWKKDRLAGTMAGLSVGSIVLTMIAILTANGPFLRYLLLPVSSLGLVLWIAAGLSSARVLQRHERSIARVVAWPVVLGLSTMSVIGIDRGRFTDSYDNPDVMTSIENIASACGDLPDNSIVEVGDGIEWFDALPILIALDRCGQVRVLGRIGFLAGQPYQAQEDENPNVFITRGATSGGASTISTTDTVTISVTRN